MTRALAPQFLRRLRSNLYDQEIYLFIFGDDRARRGDDVVRAGGEDKTGGGEDDVEQEDVSAGARGRI